MAKKSVTQRQSSEILNDKLLTKIFRYLDLNDRTKISFVSKQFSRCYDLYLSKIKSITICTRLSGTDLPVTNNTTIWFDAEDMRHEDNHFHEIGFDLEAIQQTIEVFLRKFTNIIEITLKLWSVSTQLVEWLAQIFTQKDAVIYFHQIECARVIQSIYEWKQTEIDSIQRCFADRILQFSASTDLISKCDFSRFQSLELLHVFNKGIPGDHLGNIAKWPRSLKVIEIQGIRITKEILEKLCQSNAAKKLMGFELSVESNVKEVEVFQMIGQNITFLRNLKISVEFLESIDSLLSLNRLRIFESLYIDIRNQTQLSFHPLLNKSPLDALKKLYINGDYRLENIYEMNEMFPNLKELVLLNFQIESKESEDVCFESAYNQTKALIVLTHFAKIERLEVRFWKDLDFSLHYRMILKAIFEATVDCNHCLDIHLTPKEEQMKINCFMDLILFSNLFSNEKIVYFFEPTFEEQVLGFRNIYPENSSVISGQNRDNLWNQVKEQLSVRWTENTDFTQFSFYCEKYHKNSKIKFWI